MSRRNRPLQGAFPLTSGNRYAGEWHATRISSFTLASIFALTSTALAASVCAQEASTAGSPPAAKSSDQIETVVVTANKRKEDASKVGTSVSVIRGDDLVAEHITTFEDITRALPNMSFSGGGGGGNAGNGPGLSNIEIRGISSQAGSATVGVYLDDVSMTVANLYSLGSAEPKFFDLDRVEVLRGPQGTLYGASSMGGTIKFVSKQPDLTERTTDVYTEVSNTQGGGTNYTANAVLNLPLIDNEMALRIGAQTAHKSGYIDQVSPTTGGVIASGINWEDDTVFKAALKWAPTKNLTLTPAVFYQQVTTGDIDVSYINLPENETSKLVREPGSDQLLVPSLTANYAMDIGDLTSVTSFFQRKFNRTQDGTTVNSPYIGSLISIPSLSAEVGALPSAVYLNNQVRQFSEEVRLASHPYDPSVSPITWLGGAYVSDLHTNVTDNEPIFGIDAAFAAAGVSPSDPTVLSGAIPVGFPGDNSYFAQRHYHDQQEAVFGELNYYFVPTLHATVGLRYLETKDTLDRVGDLYYDVNVLTDANGYIHTTSSSSGNATTPKVSLTWDLDKTDTLYASAAEGYRAGGSNFPVPQAYCGLPAPVPQSFASDSLWSYEVGDKSRFFGNRLTVDTALFYVNWKNLQQQIPLTCGFNYNTNVGNATTYGAEVSIKAKPISSVLLGLDVGTTHATLSDSAGSNAGVTGAIDGANIPGVPKYNVSLSGRYNFSLGGDTYGFARAEAHWIGSSNGGLDPTSPDYYRSGYNTADLSGGVTWDKWELSLFVKNLFNNDTIIQHPVVQSVTNEAYRVPPRVIGLSLSAKL
jgi:outer membrane receptor protein involved in Fe transport